MHDEKLLWHSYEHTGYKPAKKQNETKQKEEEEKRKIHQLQVTILISTDLISLLADLKVEPPLKIIYLVLIGIKCQNCGCYARL